MRPMSDPAPTLATIAAAAGVSRMTVSRALRNAEGITAERREQIVAIAARLGYRPDPKLTAFMQYLRTFRGANHDENIAFAICHRDPAPHAFSPTERRFLNGVQQRCQELGYGLEKFAVAQGGFTPTRLSQILRARGIRGLIVCSAWAIPGPLDPFQQGLVCCMGGTAHPDFVTHRASANHYQTIQLVLRELCARGYNRPGLYLDHETDTNLQHCWRAGLADFLYERGLSLKPLLNVTQGWDRDAFIAWIERAKPDVVITLHRQTAEWLRSANLWGKVGLVMLDLQPGDEGIAGVDQQADAVGGAAVDLVVAQMLRNALGRPLHPNFVTVPGTFVQAGSIREIPRTAPPESAPRQNRAESLRRVSLR